MIDHTTVSDSGITDSPADLEGKLDLAMLGLSGTMLTGRLTRLVLNWTEGSVSVVKAHTCGLKVQRTSSPAQHLEINGLLENRFFRADLKTSHLVWPHFSVPICRLSG
jgi:hypothetical protein